MDNPKISKSRSSDLQLYTAIEIAERMKVSRSFAYQLMRSGEITTVRIGRAIRVRKDDLTEYILKHTRPGGDFHHPR